ncbi:MAG: tetratricopeptide repeat protein [Smithella sp.]|jgi:Flp pilus assembly protein TadD
MTNRDRFIGSFIIIIALIIFCGCASEKGQQIVLSDYKKMMALQKQKALATRMEEPSLPIVYEATAESCERLGDAYMKQGDSVAAFTEYQKSLEKDPLRSSARYKSGMIFLDRGFPEDALREFDKIISKEPGNASAYYGRARVNFSQKKMNPAKSDLSEAIKLNDGLWQAHALLGVVLDAEKNDTEAEKEYLKAIAIQPDSAAVYNDLGISRYVTGKFDKAAEAFLKAFNLAPDNRRICNNLGLALYRLGNTEDALEAFKRGGGEAAAYNNIGYLQMKDKQYNNALASLEKAVDANPSYYTRAQKNIDKVKATLKKADNPQKPLESKRN